MTEPIKLPPADVALLIAWHEDMAAEENLNEATRDKHRGSAGELRRLHGEVERLRADAEPVAWRFRLPSGKQWHFTEHRPHEYTKRGLHFEPLYTNPTALRNALKEPK
jgi:hypothetical protein